VAKYGQIAEMVNAQNERQIDMVLYSIFTIHVLLANLFYLSKGTSEYVHIVYWRY
jgi:hypothetical protein